MARKHDRAIMNEKEKTTRNNILHFKESTYRISSQETITSTYKTTLMQFNVKLNFNTNGCLFELNEKEYPT